ncbi:Type 1 glutamine amidotransferase-like domain-containing protein [Streptomyces physcomitrii]|uniref:Type 1 glutamine amidotransferase-like domain-containing protein n=1 Tax=Streptomyces physcomitrii TaxID=2724184 RepID=A0ABX1GYT3_9ACTN|nr:peptidase E [Streptomyces physcomitrii]NKI39976.1 type 1 glutamine amidotransferase-like domain-containing protein [Streptomyces physcomitrii]
MPPTRRVALLGGGFSEDPDTLLDDWALGLTGADRPRVCFLPTASGDAAGYIEKFTAAFDPATRACEPSVLSLFRRDTRDLREVLLSQDLIYVGGGSTANLLALWRLHGLGPLLREAYEAGVLLCGISAGACCWFTACLTDSFGPPSPLHDGLALLPDAFCPHYDSEPERRPALHEAVRTGALPATWALDDNTGALFREGEPAEVVAREEGAGLCRVVRRGDGVVEFSYSGHLLTATVSPG